MFGFTFQQGAAPFGFAAAQHAPLSPDELRQELVSRAIMAVGATVLLMLIFL
jgi:hypothetical protein